MSHIFLFIMVGHQGQPHDQSPFWWAHLKPGHIFFRLRLQFPFKFICKRGPLPPAPFPHLFQCLINKSRVFVCGDQYIVMKATLRFAAKASLAAASVLCFIFYCYEDA